MLPWGKCPAPPPCRLSEYAVLSGSMDGDGGRWWPLSLVGKIVELTWLSTSGPKSHLATCSPADLRYGAASLTLKPLRLGNVC